MGARLIAAAVLAALLGLPCGAQAGGWSKAAVVAERTNDGLQMPYYVQSPDGRHTQLVVSELFVRDVVYPMTGRGRVLRPWLVPDRRDVGADFALNDHGAMALAWPFEAPNPPEEEREDPCWCQVAATVRHAGGKFTPVRTVTAPAELGSLRAAIAPGGRATVLTTQWHPELEEEPLFVAEAAAGRPFGKARRIARSVDDINLDQVGDSTRVLYEERSQTGRQLSLQSPWDAPRQVGDLPGEGWFSNGDFSDKAFAGDGHGGEVLANDQIGVAVRRPGGSFGPLHQIVKAPPSDGCYVDAAMSRRIALVGWNCTSDQSATVQLAVLSPRGHLLWLSGRHPAWWSGDTPTLAVDGAGRWVAAWQNDSRDAGYDTISGVGARHSRVQAIEGGSIQLSPPDLAILRGGVAHAVWSGERRKRDVIREARLRIGG